MHGFGSRLQQEQFARATILRPLDVQRHIVAGRTRGVCLGQQRPLRELHHLVVAQREAPLILGQHIGHAQPARLRGVVHQLHALLAKFLADDRLEAGPGGGLVHPVFVGSHAALHDGFAKAPRGVDQHHAAKARLGVQREHGAGAGQIAAHHALHAHRQRHGFVWNAVVDAVHDGAVGEQRCHALAHRHVQRFGAAHMQIRLLLAGERCVGQILGGGAAANGHIHAGGLIHMHRAAGGQLLIRLHQLRADQVGQRRLRDARADGGGGGGQFAGIAGRDRLHLLRHPLRQASLAKVQAERVGGHREAVRHPDAQRRECTQHLAQRGVLSTHQQQVGGADLREWQHQSLRSKRAGTAQQQLRRRDDALSVRVHAHLRACSLETVGCSTARQRRSGTRTRGDVRCVHASPRVCARHVRAVTAPACSCAHAIAPFPASRPDAAGHPVAPCAAPSPPRRRATAPRWGACPRPARG